MIHSSLVFVLKWLPDHLVLAVSIEATWFFISKTIFNFLIVHTIFDVKECIFKIRCHQSAHSTLQWCKGQVYIIWSDQLKFCLICDIIWWRFCCICLNLKKFIWSSHLEVILFRSSMVHWSIAWSTGSQAGLEVIPHWVASNSNPMPSQNISLSNEQGIPFYSKAHDILSFFSQQFKFHAPQNIYLSRKYEANILLRIHN